MFYAYELNEDDEWTLCGAGSDLATLKRECEARSIHIYAIIGGW